MAEEWYVGSNGQQSGPFTLQQLRQMAVTGELSKADLISSRALSNGVKLKRSARSPPIKRERIRGVPPDTSVPSSGLPS